MLIQEVFLSEGSQGEFQLTDRIIYPSEKRETKIYFSFIQTDFDFRLTVKDENRVIKNPRSDIKITHQLPKPINGHFKAESAKKINFYQLKQDTSYGKKGEISASFDSDKYTPCMLVDLMNKEKLMGGKNYRRSIETYALAYIYKIVGKDDNGAMQTTQINDIGLVAFNVMDIFWKDKKAFGKNLIEFIEDGKINKWKFKYSTTGLMPEDIMSDSEKEIINTLRQTKEDILKDDKFIKMMPLSYDEFVNHIDSESSYFTANKNVNVNTNNNIELIDDIPPF